MDTKTLIRQMKKKDPEFEKIYDESRKYFPLIMEIIRLRNEVGISQAKLAELMGTSQPVISKIESGESIPNVQTLYKIAEVLNRKLEIRFVTEA